MSGDGHTASLFPGSPVDDEVGIGVKAVTAEYEDRPAQRIQPSAGTVTWFVDEAAAEKLSNQQ